MVERTSRRTDTHTFENRRRLRVFDIVHIMLADLKVFGFVKNVK